MGRTGAVSPSLLQPAQRRAAAIAATKAPPSPISKPSKLPRSPKAALASLPAAMSLRPGSRSSSHSDDDEEEEELDAVMDVDNEQAPDTEPPSPTLSFSQAPFIAPPPRPPGLPEEYPLAHPNGRPVEWVRKRDHPLAVGIPGKWYSRSDRITPVIDALSRLHKHTLIDDCCFGIFAKRQPTAAERAAKEAAERDRAAAAKHRASTNGWVCIACGNTNRHSLTETHEALVCQCGATHPRTVATHREKACAQEDDKTQHADAPGQQPDRNPAIPDFTRARPETAEERRAARLREVRGTMPGSRAKGGLAHAQSLCEREAAKAAADHAVEMGELTPREQVKMGKILNTIADMCTALTPIDDAVATRIKTSAFNVYRDAVRHERVCGDGCSLQLAPRSAVTIATAVFELEVQRLLHLDPPISDRQRLLELHDRMARSTAFASAASSTQRGSARATMELMRAPTWICCCPCPVAVQPSGDGASPTRSRPSPTPGPGGAPAAMVRTGSLASDCTDSTDATVVVDGVDANLHVPTLVVRVREAIAQVFPLLSAEVPIAVSEGATRALQSKPVRDALRENLLLREFPPQEAAYALLTAVHQRRRASEGQMGGWMPKAKLEGSAREVPPALMLEAVGTLAPLVPEEVATESEAEDDDLFE